MEKIKIQFRDFTDQEPITNIDVRFSIWVAPIFRSNPGENPDDDADLHLFRKKNNRRLRRQPDESSPGSLTAPDFSMAEKLNDIPGNVDNSGTCILQIDLAGMQQRAAAKTRNGAAAIGVIGIIYDMNVQSGLFNRIDKNFTTLFNIKAGDSFSYTEKLFLVLIDRCTTIIGHTSSTSTRLWFQVYGDELDGLYYCRIKARQTGAAQVDHTLHISRENFFTGVVQIDGLQAGVTYDYELIFAPHPDRRGPGPNSHQLTKGHFSTPVNQQLNEFLFASCNKPVDPDNPFNRWEKMARERNYDFMILLGDQIYEDGIEKKNDELRSAGSIEEEILSWEKQYVKNYSYFWKHPAIRKTFRNKPVYMIHDDHEIKDDYGVSRFDASRFDEQRFPQEEGGLRAYQLFQHVHNPGGLNPRTDSRGRPILDYDFQKEKVAFYVLNTRSSRPSINPGSNTVHPILGTEQYDRFLAWANSNEVQQSDVVFVSIPIPPVFLPSQLIDNILNSSLAKAILSAKHYGVSIYNQLDDTILGDLSIPGKIVSGAIAVTVAIFSSIGSYLGFDDGAEEEIEEYEQAMDLKERLDFRDNRRDLKNILDILFNLAEGNTRVRKNRAVFILSGDVHVGGFHKIHKKKAGSPGGFSSSILQITSSGVSHSPSLSPEIIQEFANLIDEYTSRILGTLGALFTGGVIPAALIYKYGPTYRLGVGSELTGRLKDMYFKLFYPLDGDSVSGSNYFGQPEDLLMERNFGRVKMEKTGDRKYRFYFTVEGPESAIQKALEVNLDEESPVYHDLFGQIERVSGVPSLIRVHEPGTGYGDVLNHTDDEVILTLRNEQERFYHFPLKQNGNLTGKTMFKNLQQAFLAGKPVTLECQRNSIKGAKIIRLY